MNMSYCQFENTYNNFKQCLNTLQDEGLPTSDIELDNAKYLAELAHYYIEVFNKLNEGL